MGARRVFGPGRRVREQTRLVGRGRPVTIRAMPRFSPREWIRQLRQERREIGWRGLLKKHGWKAFAAFFAFYLVRDLILYVAVPLGLAKYFGLVD